MKQAMNGLILEGISGTGKSTLLNTLLKTTQWQNRSGLSSLVLTEHYTQRVLEHQRRTTPQDSRKLLSSMLLPLETISNNTHQVDWDKRRGKNHYFSYIFERFHLTHVVNYRHITWEQVADIDQRLQVLNAKICLLTLDTSDFETRIFKDQVKNGWRNYLQHLGTSQKEIKQHFIFQQEQYHQILSQTKLPVLEINTSKTSPTQTATLVAKWMFDES